MRLLLNLIGSLTDEETARLARLKLRGKQKAMMDLVLKTRTTGSDPTPEDITTLDVSDSHLYEMTSVLLDKCEDVLAPEGGLSLLEFFAYKNLVLCFKQELKRQQKKIVPKTKEAEEFYLTGFELLLRFSYNLTDLDLIKEYAQFYISSKRKATPEDILAIDARLLFVRMVSILADGKNRGNDSNEVLAQLKEIEKTARISSHSYLSFATY